MTLRRRCDRCNRSRFTLAEDPAISSDSVWTSCRPSASCTVASFSRRGVPLRGIFRTSTALPDDLILLPSISRPAALLGSSAPFAGLFPRMGGWTFLPFRAHMSLRRRASAPIYFRRGDRSPHLEFERRSIVDLAVGVALDFWALTPICDPHPSACGQRTDPALGFASCRVSGRIALRTRSGPTPTRIISLREHAPRVHANRASQPAHGIPAMLRQFLQRLDGADA